MQFKRRLTLIHFALLSLVILNGLIYKFFTVSLIASLEFILELSVLFSGLIVFFFYLKPISKQTYYLLFYPLIGLVFILALLFRGSIFSFILLIVLYPVFPDNNRIEQDGIILTHPFTGMSSHFNNYQVKERCFLLFEKDLEKIQTERPIDFETVDIQKNPESIEIIYIKDTKKEIISLPR